MSIEMFDIAKAFEDDIKTKSALPPIVYSGIPKDSASMRIGLRNAEEDFLAKSSNARSMRGEMNIQISHKLGSSKFTMLKLAKDLVSQYPRGASFGNDNFKAKLESVRTGTIYQTEGNENINVIVSFIAFSV
jgi:hypothetical protein